jgi:hypothetical protein
MQLDGRGSIRDRGNNLILHHQRPDRIWVPPSPYLKGTVDSFPGGKMAGPSSSPLTSKHGGCEYADFYLQFPLRLHGFNLR